MTTTQNTTFEQFCQQIQGKTYDEERKIFKTFTSDEQRAINIGFEVAQHPAMNLFYLQALQCRTDRTKAGYEFDAELFTERGFRVTIEEKFRTKEYGDLLVELLQDCRPPLDANNAKYKLGWFYTEKAERLVYGVGKSYLDRKPQKIYTVNLELLRTYWQELTTLHHPEHRYSPLGKGYTLNAVFKWDFVLAQKYRDAKGVLRPLAQEFVL